MTLTIKRGKIGKEDVFFGEGKFYREDSSNVLREMTKINAGDIPLIDASGLFDSEYVEQALMELVRTSEIHEGANHSLLGMNKGLLCTSPWEPRYHSGLSTLEMNIPANLKDLGDVEIDCLTDLSFLARKDGISNLHPVIANPAGGGIHHFAANSICIHSWERRYMGLGEFDEPPFSWRDFEDVSLGTSKRFCVRTWPLEIYGTYPFAALRIRGEGKDYDGVILTNDGDVYVGDGNSSPDKGASGSFTSNDGKTITVSHGIITSIV